MWKRNSRCLELTLIFIFSFVFLINCIDAKNISFSYPNEIFYGETFSVEVNLIDFPDDDYDVKIEAIANDLRLVRIFDVSKSKYVSTYYYIFDAIKKLERSARFTLNVTEDYQGPANLIVKVRDSSGKADSFPNYIVDVKKRTNIKIEQNQEEMGENYSVKISEEENNQKDKIDEVNKSESDLIDNIDTKNINVEKTIENLSTNEKIIYLEPKSIKKPENKEIIFQSDNEKIKKYAIYGFVIFCILVIILVILENVKKDKNK